MTLLKKVAEGKQHYRNGQKIVFDICATRWVENVDDYEKFLSAIVYIVEALEVITHKRHLEKYADWGVWDAVPQKRARNIFSYFGKYFIFIFDPYPTNNKMLSRK